jgi:hypothetical protein
MGVFSPIMPIKFILSRSQILAPSEVSAQQQMRWWSSVTLNHFHGTTNQKRWFDDHNQHQQALLDLATSWKTQCQLAFSLGILELDAANSRGQASAEILEGIGYSHAGEHH